MSLLEVHRAHLERQRHAMNLIGPGDAGFHYADCELALQWLKPSGRWADLGSGAGFPGIVLAARFPELGVDLVESRLKRCVFLEQVLLEAGTDPARVRVLRQRVEDLPASHYDGVVARAFAPVGRVLHEAHRLLRPGGQVVLFLQDGPDVASPEGLHVFHVERYRVSGRTRRAVGLERDAS